MQPIVEYSSFSSDPNLLGAVYKILFDLLIFYLERLDQEDKKYYNELELVLDFLFKVLSLKENSRLLPLIVYEIDNIQYKKVTTLLCNFVFNSGQNHYFFQKFIKISKFLIYLSNLLN